jgi:hypothetical protein
VYKKDAYQQYIQEQQDPHLLRLLRAGHPDALDMQRSHTVHEGSLDAVVHANPRLLDVLAALPYPACGVSFP